MALEPMIWYGDLNLRALIPSVLFHPEPLTLRPVQEGTSLNALPLNLVS